jgi:hypothetical protein
MVVFSFPEERKYHGRVIYYFRCPLEFAYVGYATDFKARVDKHRRTSRAIKDGDWKSKSIWNSAIRRIGWDNLRVKILEYVPEGVCMKTRERWWIAKLKTQDPYGYNSNKGGGGPTKHTEEAKAKISAGLMGIGAKPVTSREILESYDDGTQRVKFVSYASATEAARQTGVDDSNISACCNEKVKSAGNRFWHYTEEDDLEGTRCVQSIGDVPMLGNEQRKRAVISKSPGGKKQQHEGARAAGRTLSKSTRKKFDQGNITRCCQGNQKSHHGYKFCYASDEE